MSDASGDRPGEAEAPSHLSPGFLVGGGRYTLLRQIGRGGMGVVWLAHDERLNESVALKFLSSLVRNDPVELARLRQETQKSRKLTHANIIRIYDLYEAPGEPAFISMEYVNGPDLWQCMTQQPHGVFAWSDLKPLVGQLCEALAYAHGERVIHRDLKPTNLMLAENKRLKLADFGLAALALQVDPASVERRFGGGTLTHMSPQQLEGEVAAVTDDIYSLGATLYDLLCGQPPFYEGDIRQQLRHKIPTPLLERLAALKVSSDVPPEVASLIMACLAKDPSKRPQGASAVAEWIGWNEAGTKAEPTLASSVFSAPPLSEPEEEPAKQEGWGWLAALGVLVCVGLLIWFNRPSPPPTTNTIPDATSNADGIASNVLPVTTNPATIDSNAVAISTNVTASDSSPIVPAIASAAVDPYLQAVRSWKPLAFWRLDEASGSTAFDIINGYDGVYNNVVVGQPRRDSIFGSSKPVARFGLTGGAPSFVIIPKLDLSVPSGGSGAFSVAAWVEANPLSKSGAGIICKGDGTGHEQFCLDCGGIDNAFRFFFRDASGSTCWTRSSIRPDNRWHFLVGVCDQGHDRVYIYVDGTNAAHSTAAAGTGVLATGRPTTIGARDSLGRAFYDDQFVGAISDVAIFTNVLNSQQILALYNAAKLSAKSSVVSAESKSVTTASLGSSTINGDAVFHFKGILDGSEKILITHDGALWSHVCGNWPTGPVAVNNTAWNPGQKSYLTAVGPEKFLPDSFSLTSVRLDVVEGRDVVALERTSQGIMVYLDDTPNGGGEYNFSIHFHPAAPKAARLFRTTIARLKIAAHVDGSECIKITAAEAVLEHKTWGLPDKVSVNGLPWDVRQTRVLKNEGATTFLPEGVNFSTARIVSRKGRDLATAWAEKDVLWVRFADNPIGSDAYAIDIAFGP